MTCWTETPDIIEHLNVKIEHLNAEVERLRAALTIAEGCSTLAEIGVDAHSAVVQVSKETMGKLIAAEAEIERLRRELSYHVHTDEDIKIQNAEIERLEQEVERLRAALRCIIDYKDALTSEDILDVARAALEAKT